MNIHLNNHRILVIDDNRSIQDDFRKILIPSGNLPNDLGEDEAALFGDATVKLQLPVFEVDSAYQGQEGLEQIEKSLREGRPYALAFIDVRMPPGWDGIETTCKIWEADPELQVVICTAYSDYSWEDMLKTLGYSDRMLILKKPFDNIEVLQLAIAMTEKWRLHRQAKLRLDDLKQMVQVRTLELKTANAELTASNLLLIAETKKARQMTDAALAASLAKSEFLAHMSHEIRTPMTGVIGVAEVLRDTELSATQLEYVETIHASGSWLLHIISDILDVSRIESGRLKFEVLDFDLQEVLVSALDTITSEAQAKNIELVSLVEPDVPTRLRGDPGRVGQVLTNLLGNAIKFTERGEVSLHVSVKTDKPTEVLLQFEVKDTGIGISAEAQTQIFEVFVQADSSTTRKYGGSGLGLTISKRLAEKMEGSLSVESTLGKGSTFRFMVRLAKQAKPRIEVSAL